MFFIRSTYFVNIWTKLWRLILSDLRVLQALNFRTICVNLHKSDKFSCHTLGQMVTKYIDLTKNNLLKPRKPWGNPETTSRLTLFPRLEKRFENEMTSSRHGSRSAQVVLCQINISCHQFTQWKYIDRLCQIYTNCSEIQTTSFASFQFRTICKSDKISRHILG